MGWWIALDVVLWIAAIVSMIFGWWLAFWICLILALVLGFILTSGHGADALTDIFDIFD